MVLCLVDHAACLPFAIVGILAVVLGGPSLVFLLIGLIVAAYWGQARIGLQTLAWLGLLVALPANVTVAWLSAYGGLNC